MQATLTVRQDAMLVVKSSLKVRRKALEFSLRQYRARLTDFERQHQMASERVWYKVLQEHVTLSGSTTQRC